MATFIFVLAGLAEVGEGYLIWLWIRESKPELKSITLKTSDWRIMFLPQN